MNKKIINNIADKFVYQVQETDSFKKGDLVLTSLSGLVHSDKPRGYIVTRVASIEDHTTSFETLDGTPAGSIPNAEISVLKITKTDNPSLNGIPKFM